MINPSINFDGADSVSDSLILPFNKESAYEAAESSYQDQQQSSVTGAL